MSLTHVPAALRRQVRERAGELCEYCRIPESMTWSVHTLDHITAEKHGGVTAADNLELACTLCNSCREIGVSSLYLRQSFRKDNATPISSLEQKVAKDTK